MAFLYKEVQEMYNTSGIYYEDRQMAQAYLDKIKKARLVPGVRVRVPPSSRRGRTRVGVYVRYALRPEFPYIVKFAEGDEAPYDFWQLEIAEITKEFEDEEE